MSDIVASRSAGAADFGGPPIYELKRVAKWYARGSLHALDCVDLTLQKGSFCSLLGPTGCGKSSLLKIMAGVLRPTGGTVSLSGTPVTGPRGEVGMLFKRAPLFPWRTMLENVVLPIEVRGGRQAAPAKHHEARSLLEEVGLSGLTSAYPSELSGGMVQRAAFCRMLITNPAVLLLDEPFSALDEPSRHFMNMRLQCACRERNATALLVTESIPEAVLLSDVVFVMSPRPGRFIDEVLIDLPRPRALDMVTAPRFSEYVDRVRGKLI